MRYTVDFGPTNHLLALTMTSWLDLSTLAAPVNAAPPIYESPVAGVYYFDYNPSPTDPEILWSIDIGITAPDQTNRYRRGVVRPSDTFLDQPQSSVVSAVNAATTAASGAKTSADQALTDLATLNGLAVANETAVAAVQTVLDEVVPTIQGSSPHDLTELWDRIGTPTLRGEVGGSIAEDLHDFQTDMDSNVVPLVDTIDTNVQTILNQQGTPADGSSVPTEFGRMAAIISAGGGGGGGAVGASSDSPGAPTVFGQLYATRDAIRAKTDLIPADFATELNQIISNITRLLGLSRENSVLDQTVFDSRNNLTSARLRIFASRADALSQVNPTGSYTITATYVGGTTNIQSYQMVRET